MIDHVIEYATKSHLETEGGYPFDYALVDVNFTRVLLVAEHNDNDGTSLVLYDLESAREIDDKMRMAEERGDTDAYDEAVESLMSIRRHVSWDEAEA